MVHLRVWVASVFIVCMLSMLGGCKTVANMPKGLQEDTSDFWSNMRKADNWIREKLW